MAKYRQIAIIENEDFTIPTPMTQERLEEILFEFANIISSASFTCPRDACSTISRLYYCR